MSPTEKSTVFSQRLRKMRTIKGFTSKHMAALLGVAPSSYSQYENGKRELLDRLSGL